MYYLNIEIFRNIQFLNIQTQVAAVRIGQVMPLGVGMPLGSWQPRWSFKHLGKSCHHPSLEAQASGYQHGFEMGQEVDNYCLDGWREMPSIHVPS